MPGSAEKSAFAVLVEIFVGDRTKGVFARLLRGVAIGMLLPGLALGLAGCGSGPIGGSVEALQQSRAVAQSYQLNAGDKVQIAIFNEDNLSGSYVVAPDGQVTLPLAGGIKAAGLTLAEFQQAVVERLKDGIVQEPNVTVSAVELRPYYILGEVKKPGKYSYLPDLTVLSAVATAEGFTYRANMNAIYIRRANDPSEREYPLTATMAVMPGDTIRITQRYF
jgi:polysaccharide export outer membrane protein